MTKNNIETSLIVDNKLMACEIISLILELEINVRVIKLTQTLKKLVQKSKKVETNCSVNLDQPEPVISFI